MIYKDVYTLGENPQPSCYFNLQDTNLCISLSILVIVIFDSEDILSVNTSCLVSKRDLISQTRVLRHSDAFEENKIVLEIDKHHIYDYFYKLIDQLSINQYQEAKLVS